jgi:hypothetical protein
VVILCPAGWGLRNFVHGGIVADLERRGIPTSVLVPLQYLHAAPDWGATATGLELLAAPVIRSQRGHAALNALLRASFARRHHISTYRIFNRWILRRAGLWHKTRTAVIEALSLAGSREPFYSWQVRNWESLYTRSRDIGAIRRQLRVLEPSVLVSTNCQMSEELPYLIAARELGVPTLGCIQSFDNLSSRSVLPVFDYYALWNRRMLEQLLAYYPDRLPETALITGTPQFDFHVRADCRWSRRRTLDRLGLAPTDRYILWAANHQIHTPDEPEQVLALALRCSATPELGQHRIVVRPHPGDDPCRWRTVFDQDARVVLSLAWEKGAGLPSPSDQGRLVSSLLHADVCVNMASTMSLDAAVVDTPVVCVAFGDRYRHSYETEHFRPIAESGGVRLALNLTQLVGEIVAYVRDRSRDRSARQALVVAECGSVDGESARRITDLIADIAGRRFGPRSAATVAPGMEQVVATLGDGYD